MKHPRYWVTAGVLGLLAVVGALAMPRAQSAGLGVFSGGAYLITINDSEGNFASRGVMTLHADGTMSVIDSGQGGTAYYFSSQLGRAWITPSASRRVAARPRAASRSVPSRSRAEIPSRAKERLPGPLVWWAS